MIYNGDVLCVLKNEYSAATGWNVQYTSIRSIWSKLQTTSNISY